MGATAVAPVAPVDTSLILLYIRPIKYIMYVEVNWSIDNKETIIAVIFLLVTYYID